MKLGVNVSDHAIDERIRMLAPNQCCSLIFTVSVYFCLADHGGSSAYPLACMFLCL